MTERNGTRVYFCFVILCLTFLLAGQTYAREESFAGRVTSVIDGDTLKVLRDGREIKIRLAKIDCPELRGQPYGRAAKKFMSSLTFRKVVKVQEQGTDRYGRVIGTVFLPDGRCLNNELVGAGLAWVYRRYAGNDQLLLGLEAEARRAKRGLWSQPDPGPPWEYRRKKESHR